MNNRTVSLTFSTGDLPMIAHAFIIARATAMLCGHKIAKKRLNDMVKMVEALIPEEARLFEPEHWAEICASIADCKEYSVTIGWPEWDRHSHFTGKGRIRVRVDNEIWLHEWLRSGVRDLTTESPEFIAVKTLLEQLAGLDSKQVEDRYDAA